MEKEKLVQYYKENLEWYKKRLEQENKHIKWLGKQIKDEKYEWGYSIEGKAYIKLRQKAYRDRKYYKERIQHYLKEIDKLTT